MSRFTIKKDEDTGEFYIDIKDLSDMFEDVSLIEYYTLEKNTEGVLTLEVFDKCKNKISPLMK
jgi:hypothetical protein